MTVNTLIDVHNAIIGPNVIPWSPLRLVFPQIQLQFEGVSWRANQPAPGWIGKCIFCAQMSPRTIYTAAQTHFSPGCFSQMVLTGADQRLERLKFKPIITSCIKNGNCRVFERGKTTMVVLERQ